mmetsp:Transcript_14929/g.24697  ORF Transcript_14929/g.24697 Transcript_14929/m.24697 type:complete len:216 (-) Transcript_14929:991-1638(-)
MDNLETRSWTSVDSTNLSTILGSDNRFRDNVLIIWKDNVTNLKELETSRETGTLVVLESLEQTRQKCRSHHLVFNVGRVREGDSCSHGATECGEVVANGAQTMSQYFNVTSTSNFFTKEVTEVVERLLSSNGTGGRNLLDDVVVTIGNTNVLCNIDWVQNITTSCRDCHLQNRIVLQQLGRTELNLVAQGLHLLSRNVDSNERIAKSNLGTFPTR